MRIFPWREDARRRPACCAKSCEIENPPDAFSAAIDDADALALAGIIGDWSEACEHGGLFAAQGAEFGEMGDERGGDKEADAWDGSEDIITCAEARLGSDP